LSHGTQRNYLFLGYSCKPDQWNEGLSRFEPKYKKYQQHNKILEQKEKLIDDILNDFEFRNLEFSLEPFKKQFQKKRPESLNIFGFYDTIIDELEKANKLGNAQVHRSSKKSLELFHPGTLLIQDIDKKFLEKYKNWLRSQVTKKGDKWSDRTISLQLRTLRAVIYRAIDEELMNENLNPFGLGRRKFKVNDDLTLETRKRAIKQAEIEKFYTYSGEYQNTKNMFLFSYLTGGMNFTDMAYLKWKNIKNGRIEYKRRKTGKESSINITDKIQTILNQYQGREFIFPILFEHNKTEQQKRTRIQTANKKYNKELREIASELKINVHLTGYVARHTSATVLYKEKGASVSEIKEFMGHSDEKTTETYLKSIDQGPLDKLQEQL
jgi:integrase